MSAVLYHSKHATPFILNVFIYLFYLCNLHLRCVVLTPAAYVTEMRNDFWLVCGGG